MVNHISKHLLPLPRTYPAQDSQGVSSTAFDSRKYQSSGRGETYASGRGEIRHQDLQQASRLHFVSLPENQTTAGVGASVCLPGRHQLTICKASREARSSLSTPSFALKAVTNRRRPQPWFSIQHHAIHLETMI